MLRGLWKLTWLEIKIFVREPLGSIGTSAIPVLIFVVLGARARAAACRRSRERRPGFGRTLPVFAALLDRAERRAVARDDHRDLPRGRHPQAAARDAAPAADDSGGARARQAALHRRHAGRCSSLAGRRYYPVGADVPLRLVRAGAALQHVEHSVDRLPHREHRADRAIRAADRRALILYPMIGVSGLFVPVDALPPPVAMVATVLPLTAAASLLNGIWRGDGWRRTWATYGADPDLRPLHGAVGEGVPMGVDVVLIIPSAHLG